MTITRRDAVRALMYGGMTVMAGCAAHNHEPAPPPSRVGFEPIEKFGRVVYRIGRAEDPPVVLLHELPGLTPDDIRLARDLAGERFNVYVPLLFGNFGQDEIFTGLWQACRPGVFECAKKSTRSPVLDWLETVCDGVAADRRRPIGVIGMCLTGILPLALLRDRVDAAVVCQPTIPFTALATRPILGQKSDLGLGAPDLDRALQSRVPFLAMRYASDNLCPTKRMDELRKKFSGRIATIEVKDKDGHSTLGSSLHKPALADTVSYLRVRLGVAPGPLPMTEALFQGRPCEITAAGWRAV